MRLNPTQQYWLGWVLMSGAYAVVGVFVVAAGTLLAHWIERRLGW